MSIRSIKKLKNLAGKRVLVRVDFNVPIKKGKVMEDMRLLASLPTLQYLLEKKAKVIVATHLGRPDGKVVSSLKLDPMAKRLSELLKKKVQKLDTGNWQWSGEKLQTIQREIADMQPGEIVMLDNIRFSPHEQKDTDKMSETLSALGDIFVLDGFAVAHRADASVAGVAKHLPSYAGFLLEKEIKGLEQTMKKSLPPFVAIVGGAKMETKLPVIDALLPRVDHLLIGGGMYNTYLAALGYGVGDSLVDKELQSEAKMYAKKKNIVFPVDVIVGTGDGSNYRHVSIQQKPHVVCQKGESIFDIGPETIRLFSGYIKEARTLLWNGAVGYFEQTPYDVGTKAIARLVATRSKGKAFGVIGGGETVQAMSMVGMSEYVDLVSTGGGAMLEYIAGKKLPGIFAVTGGKK